MLYVYVNICKEMQFAENSTICRVLSVECRMWSLSAANGCISHQLPIGVTVGLRSILVCRRRLSSSFSGIINLGCLKVLVPCSMGFGGS